MTGGLLHRSVNWPLCTQTAIISLVGFANLLELPVKFQRVSSAQNASCKLGTWTPNQPEYLLGARLIEVIALSMGKQINFSPLESYSQTNFTNSLAAHANDFGGFHQF